MNAELLDSLEFIYEDSRVSRVPRRQLDLDVARGATAAVHILIEGLEPGTKLDVRATEQSRPLRGIRVFRLVSVPVEVNTGLIGFTEDTDMGDRGPNAPNPFVARRAPFRVFDAMQPAASALRVNRAAEALRIHIPIAPDSRRGARAVTITVSAAGEAQSFALNLRVHGARIPAPGAEALCYTNWFSIPGIASAHGVTPWSAGHWTLIRDYALLMARGRQNVFRVSLPDVFSDGAAGTRLDAVRLRRLVRVFTDAGMHFIEGGQVAIRQPGGGFLCDRFVNKMGGQLATSPEGNAALAHVARQLMSEIERSGWRHRWLQHVADEPCRTNASDYRILCGMVRRHMPGIPLLEATCDRSLAGAVDIWCPQVHELHAHREEFEAYRRTGDRLWFYTCCEPGGRWLNRLLDQELLRPALLGWAAALYRADGFLHWGLNKWHPSRSPFEQSINRTEGAWPNSLPAGDTHVVYPGPDGPWSSVRFEAQREGMEDAERLRRLQEESPRTAAAVLKRALRSAADYTTDVKVFRKARRALLTASDQRAHR